MAQLTFKKYLGGLYKLNLLKSNSVHYAIIQSIYDCFIKVNQDIDAMRLELCISTASGSWLDYWGEFFSVFRRQGEDDSLYSQRIITTVTRPKATIPSIKDHLANYLNWKYNKEYTSADIYIKEPWTELGKYSHKGLLSSTARLFSGDYYSHAVIDVSIPEDITEDIKILVSNIKAAGVKVYWSILNQWDIIDGFYLTDEVKAFYSRKLELTTLWRANRGLILSNSSFEPKLSGKRQIWWGFGPQYDYYAKDNPIPENKNPIVICDSYALWLVGRNKNWLFGTPLMSLDDLYNLWSDFRYGSYTLQDIYNYEDNQDDGYLTFGDLYQPPIEINAKKPLLTTYHVNPWLFSSQIFQISDLEQIFAREISGDVTLEKMIILDNKNPEKYPVAGYSQGSIAIVND